jgi:hypothetical protein
LQLRQDELKTQIVAAQAANWHDGPRAARNGAAMAVQYGGRDGERATQKQSREEEAEGGQEQVKNLYSSVAVGSDTADVSKALHRQENPMRAERDDTGNLAASIRSATDRA